MATHTILENPMDREDWWAIVHSVTKSGTQLSMHARRKVKVKAAQSCLDSLRPHGLYSPWNSPGQDIGVVAFLFSRGSSQPREQTQVSHIAGRFFTSGARREAQEYWSG